MTDQPERPFTAAQIPFDTGGTPAIGVHAPIGAVSRKERARAAKTALHRDGAAVVLETALPGMASLQRWAPGGAWESVERRPASRDGHTTFDLPPSDAPATYRVVFAPKNEDITSWVSEDIPG